MWLEIETDLMWVVVVGGWVLRGKTVTALARLTPSYL